MAKTPTLYPRYLAHHYSDERFVSPSPEYPEYPPSPDIREEPKPTEPTNTKLSVGATYSLKWAMCKVLVRVLRLLCGKTNKED